MATPCCLSPDRLPGRCCMRHARSDILVTTYSYWAPACMVPQFDRSSRHQPPMVPSTTREAEALQVPGSNAQPVGLTFGLPWPPVAPYGLLIAPSAPP